MSLVNELENCLISISASENSIVSDKESGKKFASEREEGSSLSSLKKAKANPNLIYKKDLNMNKTSKTKKVTNGTFSIKDVFITKDEYDKLKTKHSYELNNNEILAMRVFEKYSPIEDEIIELRRNNLNLRKKNLELEEESSFLKVEKEKISNIKDTKILSLTDKVDALESENKRLAAANRNYLQSTEENLPKIHKYDELYEKYKKMSVENEKLLETTLSQNNLIVSLKKEKEEIFIFMFLI